MTLARSDSLESAVPSLSPEPRVKVTVRLYAGSHELLVEEFATLGRRRRAARAAQLMLLGLLFERATLRPGPLMMGVSPPSKPPATDRTDYGLAPEADSFLSAILRTSQPDRERSGGDASSATQAPEGSQAKGPHPSTSV